MEKLQKKVLVSEKSKKKFFPKNPKQKVVACYELSKTLKNMSNGPKLTKNAQFFVRGGIKLLDIV